MEINGSKEANFNFDTKETSSLDDSNLDAPMGRHESRPRHASQMAPNALDASTSNRTLSPNEGSLALKFGSKECDIVATILNDDHPLPKAMEQWPSSSTCHDGVPNKKIDASLPKMQLIKTWDIFEMDPFIIPPSNEVGLSDGTKDVAKEVLGNS